MAINALIVDTLEDENDGPDVGGVSLRDALAAIEPGGTITFADDLMGTLVLSGTELGIDRAVSIDGGGDITVDANGQSRVLYVDDGDPETQALISISGLTITGGSVSDMAGGGILSVEDLTLNDSIVTGNSVSGEENSFGGGIFITYGNLSLNESVISGNSSDGSGGGIMGIATDLSVYDSIINSNFASSNGGGVSNVLGGTLNLVNSTISDNSVGESGGGVYNALESTLSIANSTISDNSVGDNGGGVFNFYQSTLSIANSTISGNSADGSGGGVYNALGDTLNLVSSTISGNSAGVNGGGIGSATDLVDAFTSITNSTISGNSADNLGGGIFNFGGQVILSNSTITANTALAGTGSGIASFGDAYTQTTITSSIISGNPGPDVDLAAGTTNSFISNGNNLIGDGNAIAAFNNDGDITGNTDPGLAPLTDNGGPTQTIALLSDSPAIDAGSNPSNLETDQRGVGFARIIGAAADIGAFEAGDTADNPGDSPADSDPVNVDLNVDGAGEVVPSTDVLNIFRVLAGAPQAVVIPEGANASQQAIADAVNAIPELSLDVDGDGAVVPSVDVLNVFRVLAGAPQAVVIPAGLDVSQQDITDTVNALIA